MDTLRDIELLVRSRHGFIVIDTIEEDRAETLLSHVADRLRLPLFEWTRTRGLRRADRETGVYGTTDAAQALAHVHASSVDALYHFRGLGASLPNATVVQQLKETARALTRRDTIIVLTGDLDLPADIARLAALVTLPGPDLTEYKNLLEQILRDLSQRMRVKLDISREDGLRLLQQLKGLTLLEAEKVLTRAIVEDGRLTVDDIAYVLEAKKQIVEREGVLEYYPAEEQLSDIADLVGLKAWLGKRKSIITEPKKAAEFGLEFPKGVLLVGVPGCGKSLCAKAVAREWGLPLLKLDPATLYNKYIGETEKNLRRAMNVAMRVAPVVLWIDEIEKAFSSSDGGEDGGVSQRVLGTFLSWMQERTGDVFVVATANDVTRLPAEFLRKGRFDEIFFVDLPVEEARRAIFEIHLRKRKQDPAGFDLAALVAATDGFSGAEIEQVIVSALYTAFSEKTAVTTDTLLDEVRATRPLSETMAERITALREWACERTVSAH